jgi:hypothetical protein
MGGHLFVALPSTILASSAPRILVAENDLAVVESFCVASNRMLNIDFDFCATRDHAVRKLLDAQYNAFISSIQLAARDEFSLLKQARTHPLFPAHSDHCATSRSRGRT